MPAIQDAESNNSRFGLVDQNHHIPTTGDAPRRGLERAPCRVSQAVRHGAFERLGAEAAVTGDYQTALLAMTINPLVPSDTSFRQ